MKNLSFLFWGYAIVWIGLAGYLSYLLARLRAVDRRIERLERHAGGVRPSAPGPAGSAPAPR